MTAPLDPDAVIADCWEQGMGIAQTRHRVARHCAEPVGSDRVHREFVRLDAATAGQRSP